MDPDTELEEIMNKRYIPEMRSNLAERIIEASLHHQAHGKTGLSLWLNTFSDALLLPKPAYVMAMIFVLGLLLGGLSGFVDVQAVDSNVTDLVFTAEQVYEGDWL